MHVHYERNGTETTKHPLLDIQSHVAALCWFITALEMTLMWKKN